MIQLAVRLFQRLSARFKVDALWRITPYLGRDDRCFLMLRLLRHEADQITFRRNGTLWTGFAWDERITWNLFLRGGFQDREIEAVLRWVERGVRCRADDCVIIDVGANIGTSSIPFAQRTTCRVLAIEPVPHTFTVLQQNVRQNRLEHRITCIQAAIHRRQGMLRMVVPPDSAGDAYVVPAGEGTSSRDVRDDNVFAVPADSLDNILRRCEIAAEQVAFVWSDTEGSEASVVETGCELWAAGVPLHIEVNVTALRRQSALDLFLALLGNHFGFFIPSADLAECDTKARLRPIADMRMWLETMEVNTHTSDILLLPTGWNAPA